MLATLLIIDWLSSKLKRKIIKKDGTFLGSKFFVDMNGVFKFFLVAIMLFEIFAVPNLLELPTLILFVVYMIFFFLPLHPDNQGEKCTCCRCKSIRWVTQDSFLLQTTFVLQNFFLLFQVFELIYTRIPVI